MRTFIHHSFIQAPLAQVVAFHHDSKGLKDLSPPVMFVKLYKAEPIAEGSIVDFRMWLGPVPVRWVAVHSDVTPHGFTDTQQSGPFSSWMHRHSFRAINAQSTEVVDEIHAQPGQHIFWGLVSRMMWFGLPILFGYRGWILRRKLEGKAA